MSLGYAVKIMECIVTVYCGAILAVRPCELRWDYKAAKVAVGILVTLVAAMNILNIPWAKFSAVIYTVTGILIFIILLVFYQVNFWQLFVQNFIYWYTVKLVQIFIIYIGCGINTVSFSDYVSQNTGMEWRYFHVVSMLVISGLIMGLTVFLKEKSMIRCRKKADYKWFALFVVFESVLERVVSNTEYTLELVNPEFVMMCFFCILLLLCGIMIANVINSYKEVSHQEQMTRMNLALTRKQYDLMQNLYTQKRRQIHDEVQHDIIVRGYLKNNEADKALAYLDRKLAVQGEQHKNKYTGVTVIDLILDYKISMAKEKGIKAEVNADVLGCGMEDSDLGIVLGNLLDNAIEAVSELPEGTRKFYVGIKTKDEMLVIVTRNGYTGQRKKCDGRYETTKTDKAMHGLGLESVRLIVDKYTGCMEINDDGRNFEVMVVIYKFMD